MNPVIFLLLSIGVMLLCYAPVYTSHYLHTDDYFVMYVTNQGLDENIRLLIAGGRPLLAYLNDFAFGLAGSIGNAAYIRFAGVLGIALLAWQLFIRLATVGWPRTQAWLTGIFLCLMPTFQVYAFWAVAYAYPYAATMAGLAERVTERVGQSPRMLVRVAYSILAVSLLVVAFTLYQPAALYYWVFSVITLMSPTLGPKKLFTPFVRNLGVFGAAIALAFGIQRLGSALTHGGLSNSRTSLTTDLFGKAEWFVRGPLLDALNFFNLYSTPQVGITLGVLMLVGLSLYWKATKQSAWLAWAIALSIVPLTILPNLVVAETWNSYRIQLALTSTISLYALFALQGYWCAFKYWLKPTYLTLTMTILTAWAAFSAYENVSTRLVAPQVHEVAWVSEALSTHHLDNLSHVAVIPYGHWDALIDRPRFDEVGIPSFNVDWVVEPAIKQLLWEQKHAPDGLRVTFGEPSESHGTSGTLVLDARPHARTR